ncbi:MAG TPA: valine--tRNA ligase, partial [Gammaproteobacteria bacterium]|nr:valine--tRNA ligase [Gammaproteobacteria bacterium]
FSSALWTFSTLGWPSKDNLLKKYHPTDVLVTGFDIIFFWVARMIMMTTHFISEVPFKKIFIHGLVKDSEGQKMSKSKGNILDPLDIIDGIKVKTLIKKRTEGLMQPKMKEKIEKQTIKEFPKGIQPYGTDALRLTYCSLASGSRDVNFDLKRVEGYRNFCNKLWNAARFINLQLAENNGSGTKESKDTPDLWIKESLNEASQKVNSCFEEFRFDLATQTIYDFIWNEFCDWYIEICKIRFSSPDYQESEKKAILKSLISTLEESLRLAHPIIPFITEEIWQQFKPEHANKSPSIMISKYPTGKAKKASKKMNDIEWVKEIVTSIRNIRGEMKIKPSLKISALLQQGNKTDKQRSKDFEHLIVELAGLNSMRWIDNDEEPPASAINFHKNLKVLIPLEGLIKAVEENKRIEKNISKLTKESDSLSKQLNNDKFLNNAPPELVKNQKERFKEISKELQLLDIQLQEIQKLL